VESTAKALREHLSELVSALVARSAALERARLTASLGQLEALLRIHDAGAAQLLDELGPMLQPLAPGLAEELKRAIDAADFERALRLLGQSAAMV
jgi:hypothetical protein